jgi:Fe-S-cluster-containing dehydrogenase component
MIIDASKCIDCNNCFIACKDEHVDNEWPGYTKPQPLHGNRWINIHRQERGSYPLIDVAYRPTPCMHCENAPCVKAAPECFKVREDGIVLIDQDKAKGRKDLLSSCPYGAIYWNEELDVPQKCTMCAHLLDDGWKQPRCAQACPLDVIQTFRLSKEELAEKIKNEGLRQLHPEKGTKPRVYYKNLHLIDKAFVAGSIAEKKGEIVDCVADAKVQLFQDEKLIGEAVTDAFGDFKIDKLDCNSGRYTLCINDSQKQDIELEKSINLGTIILK